jgi:hypothetical protein
MANKLKSRRYKKKRVTPKKRQSKPRTKRYRRKTRKTRGGVKRAPITPIQEYNQQGSPFAPRKNKTRAVDDEVVGVNLFQGFPGNQENINQNIPIVTPPQGPTQGVQTPVFTPINFIGPPQAPIQQHANNLILEPTTPQGKLNDALDDAYMEAITTPPIRNTVRTNNLNIEPFGYDEDHNEIIDDEPITVVEEDYETEEDD